MGDFCFKIHYILQFHFVFILRLSLVVKFIGVQGMLFMLTKHCYILNI